MANTDLSRSAFDPRKHYASVRMQQGRVIVDDDWNENERVENEARRRTNVDIVGPQGSPDSGFQVANPRLSAGRLEFDIQAGAYYLGGLRLDMDAAERFQSQSDWLQQPPSAGTPETRRIDLVYLEAWQQHVSAVEDRELFEAALGGPDTSTRVRNMRRAVVEPNLDSTDCAEAWQRLARRFEERGEGALNANGLLETGARLTVDFDPGVVTDDLCEPSITGGFLGAENQAIRVQLVSGTEFTWGYDNAASLYRVNVAEDRSTVTLQTDPKDQEHWPLAGDTVEILPWSAVLVNGEKTAEEMGHLSLVAESYNPDDGTITLSTPLPAGFGEEWQSRPDADSLGERYFYMRAWRRGADRGGDTALSFTPGTAVELGHTGLSVTFNGGPFRPGDYWIIAARPRTPNAVVPWELMTGRRPHGVRRYRAPLALIQWAAGDEGPVPHVISDCRPRFLPLTQQDTCATFTVGDGLRSHGHFQSIQAAVDALPAAGGEIHVLPGEYREHVLVHRRRNVSIKGCGKRSLVQAIDDSPDPLFRIRDSQSVLLDSLALQTDLGHAVQLEQAGGDDTDRRGSDVIVARAQPPRPALEVPASLSRLRSARGRRVNLAINAENASRGAITATSALNLPELFERVDALDLRTPPRANEGIELRNLDISTRDRAAVIGRGGRDISVAGCRINVRPLTEDLDDDSDAGRWPAVFLTADDVRIEDNTIRTSGQGARRTAYGGVQVGGGSERVTIRRNNIAGGNGNGVTLGSLVWVPREQLDVRFTDFLRFLQFAQLLPVGISISVDERGCVRLVATPPPPVGEDGEELAPASEGALSDIAIEDNHITGMGANGVSAVHFFDPTTTEDCVTVKDLRLARNVITGCVQGEVEEAAPSSQEFSGHGGVALAGVVGLDARDNDISGNGRSHIDPLCGMFLLYVEGAVIEDNRISGNGPRVRSDSLPRAGNRGGIVIAMASPPTDPGFMEPDRAAGGSSLPAARIHRNVVIAPEGRALKLTAVGPVSVQNNHLSSMGHGTRSVRGQLTSRSALSTLPRLGVEAGNDMSAAILDTLGGGAVAINNTGSPLERRGTPREGGLQPVGDQPGSITAEEAATAGAEENQPTAEAAPSSVFRHAARLRRSSGPSGEEVEGTAATEAGSAAEAVSAVSAVSLGRVSALGSNTIYSGNTLFSGNQVSMEPAPSDPSPPLSAVAIVSSDDVSIQDNQVDSAVSPSNWFASVVAYGFTVRLIGNRLSEPLQSAEDRAFSAVTVAQSLNVSTSNEGTHCIYAQGASNAATIRRDNVAMIELINEGACSFVSRIEANFTTIRMAPGGTGASSAEESREELQSVLSLLR